MDQPKVTDFVPIEEPGKEDRPNIKVLIGAVFLVQSYEIKQGKSRDTGTAYEWAMIQTNVGPFRTATGALIIQLKEMDPVLKAGKSVRVKLSITEGKVRFVSP